MDHMQAFIMGQVNSGKEEMVFDWIKAAQIIKERGVANASAGLEGDWDYTGGIILRDGYPVPEEETFVYLASTWAKPQLEILGDLIDCYKMESELPGWDAKTYWPEEARKELE